jgi:hypothetical protein
MVFQKVDFRIVVDELMHLWNDQLDKLVRDKVCDGRQTPKSIIGNVETISLSISPFLVIDANTNQSK